MLAYQYRMDEVQFFDESMISVLTNLANKGLRVICAGLDLDFKGKPFGIIPSLLAIAERITKLTAICMCCGGGNLMNEILDYYNNSLKTPS